jgi:hypothetical protein
MRTIVKIIIIGMLFSSCTKNNKKDYVYLEINNKQLEHEIIEFTKIAENQYKEDSVVIVVEYYHVNDSTMDFTITNEFNYEYEPYHFVCEINGRDVYFQDVGFRRFINDRKKSFFQLRKECVEDITRKYYPRKLTEKKSYKVGNYVYVIVPDFYSYQCLYLSFVRDKLVKRRYRF